MLSVGLNWIYIILTTFCAGSGIGYLVEKKLRYRIRGLDSILMAGLVAVTVYAEVFSLFYKVGAVANGILAAVCLGVFCCCEDRFPGEWGTGGGRRLL